MWLPPGYGKRSVVGVAGNKSSPFPDIFYLRSTREMLVAV